MAWRTEKTREGQDLVWDEVETGIAPSPTKGTANIQNANIATETGEVMASYARTAQQQTAISGGTLTPDGATLLNAPSTLKAGTWIKVTASTVSSITAATNPATVTVNYLVVAGGGGGGGAQSGAAGGGGAGAVRTGTHNASVQSYAITVGDGGDAGGEDGAVTAGFTGEDSVFGSVVTAAGGGGGGWGINGGSPTTNTNGKNGGSGGGGGGTAATAGTAGTGTTGGNNAGTGFASATQNQRAGGGGGGAGAVGTNAASTAAGNGGNGVASSISGTSVTYGGGGGGGAEGTAGTGGTGGGGAGGDDSVGTAGTDGLGGGGGGASEDGGSIVAGGAGGSGVVIISYTTGSMYATGGIVTYAGGNTIHTFTESGTFRVVSLSTGGLYYVSYKDTNNKIKLSAAFDPTGANVTTHGTTGSITFDTLATVGSPVAKATERYTTATTVEYRYYILDTNNRVWVYDTAIYDSSLLASGVATLWMLPDPTSYANLAMTGLGALNGWILTVSNSSIYGKPTVNLGTAFTPLPGVYLNEPFATHQNYAMTGSQGKLYYCDGNYIGELFPTTSLLTSVANVQSYCSYTASTTTGTVSAIIGGSLPLNVDGTRLPVVFFTDIYGTLPTAVTQGTVYYVDYSEPMGTFNVYTAITGGSPIDIATGASGTQYFNSFYPLGSQGSAGGTAALVQHSSQRVNLPFYEVAQRLVEIGNNVLIGCAGNIVYPWNQQDATPSDLINLPESDVKSMINVNNVAYIFAGNKGNVYITNVSNASLAFKVPDYCAGVPGTPLTYIEPYFTWGDSMFLRGRVYFSVLDQTAAKAGNCGGIWSFVPSQNIDPTQDVGIALRLENQQSYGDYDGYATILIPNEEQLATSPQYWAGWQDSYSTGTSNFGIDYTATTPVTGFVVETDLVPTGTLLSQQTFTQLEYKLTTPLASGDSLQLSWRLNSTDAWTSAGTVKEETANPLSGYYPVNFQKTQWAQFRAVATTGGTTSSSFVRLKEIRLR